MPGAEFNTLQFNESPSQGNPTMSAYDDAVLVSDEDLTSYESKMPDLAKRMRGASGANAYDGKRVLAKSRLRKELIKAGVDVSTLSDPTQLKDAAVFLELALIYRDMSSGADDLAEKKADHYQSMFDEEMTLVSLSATDGTETRPTVTSIPLYRA